MANIRDITAEETHALRRTILRADIANADVHYPEDDHRASFHLGVDHSGALVGISTFTPSPTPHRADAVVWQLRGMAVSGDQQGHGFGSLMVEAAVARLRDVGASVLWCNARDTAAGFYEKLGFVTCGDGFVTTTTGLPHHVMVRDL